MAASNTILLQPGEVYHIFAHAVHANDFFTMMKIKNK